LEGSMPAETLAYRCARCGDTGWAPADGAGRVMRCACWLDQLRKWPEGMPHEFRSATLENYRALPGNAAALAAAKRFLAGARDLVLVGPIGCGKTRLACSILNTAHETSRMGLFVHVPFVLYQLQPPRDPEDAEGLAAVARLERRLFEESMVVMDDLGAERDRATDYTRRTLFMVYEARYDAGLRTIWTSNKTLDEIAAMQDDDRLASRLAGRADVVEIACPDMRIAERVRTGE